MELPTLVLNSRIISAEQIKKNTKLLANVLILKENVCLCVQVGLEMSG